MPTRQLLVGLAMLLFAFGCSSSEPEPVCDRLGSFHRLSRNEIERHRVKELVSMDEWECMRDALVQLDEKLTKRCKETPQFLDAVHDEQRTVYAACLTPARDAVVERALVRRLPER